MSRAQSSALLPAAKVLEAAKAALRVLLAERRQLWQENLDSYVAGQIKAHPFRTLLLTREKIAATLPPEIQYLSDEFRKHDQAVLKAISDLAAATLDANPDFTITVTADDFRLMADFYEGKTNG